MCARVFLPAARPCFVGGRQACGVPGDQSVPLRQTQVEAHRSIESALKERPRGYINLPRAREVQIRGISTMDAIIAGPARTATAAAGKTAPTPTPAER